MSRTLVAAAVLVTTAACVDPGAIASPDAAAVRANGNPSPCTAEEGQQLIDAGAYQAAIGVFTCVIGQDPTAVEGYRGRIEARLMAGHYSEAVRDYARVTAYVEPVHPDAVPLIIAGYQARLEVSPDAVPALAGLGFAHWWDFNYPGAIKVLDRLLELQPDDVYGSLFRGSSRLLKGALRKEGMADLAKAIALAPESPDVRYVVADAFTYGKEPDAQRAFDEATTALAGGLDTPRIRAILAASYHAFGDVAAAAQQVGSHIALVTTELVSAPPLGEGSSASLALVPGRTYDVPIVAAAGETVRVVTGSKDFWDTIMVLRAPDGTPILGSDDDQLFFAGFKWVAPAAGTYRLHVTSFEAVSTGLLLLARK